MECDSLRKMSIWCGFPGRRTIFPLQAQAPAIRKLSRPTGMCWPSGLISRPAGIVVVSCSGTDVFKEVALPAGATLGTASGVGRGSGWARLDVNRVDPVDMALAALTHVAVSSCGKYTGQFNMLVAWCEALAEPRASLPASDTMVAFYLQAVMNGANTFAPVKAASAAIAFYQKIILFSHEPTQSPAACLERSAMTRRDSI